MIGTLFLLFVACGVALASLIYGAGPLLSVFIAIPLVVLVLAMLLRRETA